VYEPAREPPGDPVQVPASQPPRILFAQRIGALAEILLCSGFPTQILLATVLAVSGMPLRTAGGQLSPTFVATLSLLDTLLVVGLIVFFLRAHDERPRDVLLGPRPVVREILVGVWLLPLVFVLLLTILAAILAFVPWLHNVPRNPLEDMLQSRRDTIMFAVVAMIAGGVREEIQRGFILHRFDRHLGGGWLGVLLYSALFGLGHIEQGFDAALAIAVLGGVWGLVYLARRSIVAPMVCHALFNLAQLVKYVVVR
jgi:membrane protease YdiL (CAAX protease family)